ncbi:MAG: hypothetical protein NVS9B14_06770 [Candidatus Acidiferrum sp.]
MIQVLRETHDTPESVERRLVVAGGRNRFGEPMYRAVWGWNRLAWIGGKFEEKDAGGNLIREVVQLRKEPKYSQVNRWHIEKWMPPETYGSPATWYAQTTDWKQGNLAALGPYPLRGEYENCFVVQGPKGEFIQLTTTIAERIARAIECSRVLPAAKRRTALYEREAKLDKEYVDWAMDVMDDGDPALHGQPFVTVA